MATDIRSTQDVSIKDDSTDYYVSVDSNGRMTVNRSWTLSSGTDSINAAQSGTWNIVNISGTVSLPTGAATETTLNNIYIRLNNIYIRQGDKSQFVNITDGTNTVGIINTTQLKVTQYDASGNAQVSMDVAARRGYVQITDGTNNAIVDASGNLYVGGKSAIGASPASNPIYICALDTSGNKANFIINDRSTTAKGLGVMPLGVYTSSSPSLSNNDVTPLRVDSSGRLMTSQFGIDVKTISLSWGNASIAPLVGNMWLNVLKYTVPTGYNLEIVEFNTLMSNANGSFRFTKALTMGTYNVGTSTFSDGSAYVSPGFASGVEIEVTTAFTGTAVTFTVTYVNESGVVGRSGTITTTAAPGVGQRFALVLQGSDLGVKDITAVTKSGGTAGVCTIYGLVELLYDIPVTTSVTNEKLISRQSIVLAPGEQLQMDFTHTTASAQNRQMRAVGLLSTI